MPDADAKPDNSPNFAATWPNASIPGIRPLSFFVLPVEQQAQTKAQYSEKALHDILIGNAWE